MVRHARQRQALWLLGAAASVAPWGSLSSPCAPQGEQPAVHTRGKRKGYKVLGLIDSCSGPFVSHTPEGRVNAESSAACLLAVLSQPRRHVVVISDGARFQTSHAMPQVVHAHEARWTREPWPSYAPAFTPIEHRWQKSKTEATPLQYFLECTHLHAEVDRALLPCAHPPRELTVLMARYCETLGAMAA
jgi:hypothetical protein